MAESKKGKWRDKTIERLNRAQAPTVFLGEEATQSGVEASDQPQFDVFQVKLRGKDDEPIIISGNVLNIELQVSLLKAVDQLLEIRGMGGSTSIMSGGGLVKRKGQPQIILWFKEPTKDVEPGFAAVFGRISFRIMDKTDDPNVKNLDVITEKDIEKIAKKIKELFFSTKKDADGNFINYTWKKGKEHVVYHDWEKGYQLQLLCRNKSDAIELVKKIVAIQDHEYEPKYLKHSVPEAPMDSYPTIPKKITVLGKEKNRDRLRPIAEVVFTHAELLLTNWHKPILLVNPYGKIPDNFS